MFDSLFSGAVGSLLSAFGGAANSALSYGINKKMAKYNADLQLKNQRVLMDKQYEQNQQSLLDSPSSTRRGLMAAGFNPMLAISDATYSPSVGLGSAGMPSANGVYGVGDIGAAFDRASNSASQRKLQEKEREKLDKLTDAELGKLEAEANAATAHSGAAMYDAETKRMEANARIEKIKKEADSIDPRIRRQNERFGGGLSGELQRLGRNIVEGAGYDFDAHPSSAKAVKVISDEMNREEKRRGDAVRNRRKHH